jgi:O-antigen/teichoic acid export membrane protein
MLTLRSLTLLLFGLWLGIFHNWLANFFNLSWEVINLLPLIFIILFFLSINSLWGQSFFNARLDQIYYSVNQIIVQVITVIGYILVLKMGKGLRGVLLIWLTAQIFSTLYYGIVNWRWFRKTKLRWCDKYQKNFWDKKLTKRLMRYAFFSFLTYNINYFRHFTIDYFVIGHYLGAKEVALYGLAATIVTFVTVINPASTLRGVFQPILIQRYTTTSDKDKLVWGQTLLIKVVIFVTLPAYIIIILLSDKIVGLIYSPYYLDAVKVLICLCFFLFFFSLQPPFGLIFNTLEKNEVYLIKGIFSLYNLLMDIILVKKYGIIGVAIATGSAGLLELLYYMAVLKWYIKLEFIFPWKTLGKGLINLSPVIILSLILRAYIGSIFTLIGFLLFTIIIYLTFSFFNKLFDEQERELFNRAIGKKIWIF